MKTRDIILGSYVALGAVSCVANKPNADDAGAPRATAATASVTSTPQAAVVEAGKPGPNARTLAYDDKSDFPANAGDARCPEALPPKAKPASVTLELAASPPGIDVVIPSLGVKQKLWAGATNPKECRASLDDGGAALRFRCTDDQSTIDGKLYARKSDVIIGRATTAGTGTTKFVLPCGTAPKLEAVACPSTCKKSGDVCTCTAK